MEKGDVAMKQIDCSSFIDKAKKLTPRHCLEQMMKFLEYDVSGESLLMEIYGLRSTGKTTLMQQLVALSDTPIDEWLYLEADDGDTIDDVEHAILQAQDNGIKHVIIDEITNLKDFINHANILADVLASSNLHIIIAGTDSLSIAFANKDSLYHRVIKIPTTYISFAEHCQVYGQTDLDDYIKHGGLMDNHNLKPLVHDISSCKDYVNTSIAENISRSVSRISNINDSSANIKKIPVRELSAVIERMVEDYSGKFDLDLFTKELFAVVLTSIPKEMTKESRGTAIFTPFQRNQLQKQRQEIIKEFTPLINATGTVSVEITTRDVNIIQEYLEEMDVLSITHTKYFRSKSTEPFKNIAYGNNDEIYLIQPSIKYYHLIQSTNYIKESERYDALSEAQRTATIGFVETYILGLMTEQVVLFDVKHSLPLDKYSVYKTVFTSDKKDDYRREIDLMICDKEANAHWSFEIKHSSELVQIINEHGFSTGQDKNLVAPEVVEVLNRQYGKSQGTYVLYNGKSSYSATETVWLNISDFLIAVDKYKDMDLAIKALLQDIPIDGSVEQIKSVDNVPDVEQDDDIDP